MRDLQHSSKSRTQTFREPSCLDLRAVQLLVSPTRGRRKVLHCAALSRRRCSSRGGGSSTQEYHTCDAFQRVLMGTILGSTTPSGQQPRGTTESHQRAKMKTTLQVKVRDKKTQPFHGAKCLLVFMAWSVPSHHQQLSDLLMAFTLYRLFRKSKIPIFRNAGCFCFFNKQNKQATQKWLAGASRCCHVDPKKAVPYRYCTMP